MSVEPQTKQLQNQYISYSQINDFIRCPYLWYAKRVLGIKGKPKQNAIRGILLHNVVDRIARATFDGEECSLQKIRELLYKVAVSNPELLLEPDDLSICTQILTNAYANNMFNFNNTIACELAFEIPLDHWKLRGRIDRLDIDDYGIIIIDYKTGYYLHNEETLIGDLQFCIYDYAISTIPEYQGVPTKYCIKNILHCKDIFSSSDKSIVLDRIDYTKMIANKISTTKRFAPTPGEACRQFGGCEIAGYCASTILRHTGTTHLDADFATMSDDDLIALLSTLTDVVNTIKKHLNERNKDNPNAIKKEQKKKRRY